MYSTKESENKATECIFSKRKFREDERAKIQIKCFQLFSVGASDCTAAENTDYICDFINRIEAEMVFENLENIIFIAKNNYIL